MASSPCREERSLRRGPWAREEDEKLLAYIQEHGHGRWRALPQKAGLQRCGKSCRLRWINYLRPDIKRGEFTLPEEQSIIQLHALLGNRWALIASHLPRRTDNEIKNYWNTHLKKRLTKMGVDPATHRRKCESKNEATLSHLAQWECTRLEAEARLVRDSTVRQHQQINSLHFEFSQQTHPEPAASHPLPPLSSHQVFDEFPLPHCLYMPKRCQDVPSKSMDCGCGLGVRDNLHFLQPSNNCVDFNEGYMNLSHNKLSEWKLSAGDRYCSSGGSFEEINKNCWNYNILDNCGTLESLVFSNKVQ